MMDFKVYAVKESSLTSLNWLQRCQPEQINDCTKVVRLAEVETLIQEAEWAMQTLVNERRWMWSQAFDCSIHDERIDRQFSIDDIYIRAQAFLASVSAWRKGQEGEK